MSELCNVNPYKYFFQGRHIHWSSSHKINKTPHTNHKRTFQSNLFEIDKDTGEIRVAETLDRENIEAVRMQVIFYF